MKEYCTILFTNDKWETAAIVVASFEEGDKTLEVVRHAKHKKREYERAFLLTTKGFLELEFFCDEDDRGNEVLLVLEQIVAFRSIADCVQATEDYKPTSLEPLR